MQNDFLRSICRAEELPAEIRIKRGELLESICPAGLAAGLRFRQVGSLADWGCGTSFLPPCV
jgi:hypothetical protein